MRIDLEKIQLSRFSGSTNQFPLVGRILRSILVLSAFGIAGLLDGPGLCQRPRLFTLTKLLYKGY